MRTLYLKILFALSFTLVINIESNAQDLPKKSQRVIARPANLLVDKPADTITKPEKVVVKIADSIATDSIPQKKEFLDGIITYTATDYVSMNQRKKLLKLYNEAMIQYTDLQITAGVIEIDYSKDMIYAGRIKDTAGNYTQNPIFTQGTNVVEPDSIIFNTKTKKALVFNSRTTQSEFNVIAPRTKKENDSVYFLEKGRFTTSENLDDPEYEFIASKIKLVPEKKIVVGPTNMEIYGVPTPLWLPFAYFPLTDKATSGILLPSFGEDTANDRGYNLQNLGYYFAISDNIDLAVYSDIYTNGSYGLRSESSYAKRYKFRGNFGVRYEKLINSERGFPDFRQNTIYNIRWSHSQDSKANPSSRFAASVNLGSSRYYQESIRQANLSNTQNNTLSSSVSYSKSFEGEPQINYSVAATHRQNTQTQQINLTLPTFQGSMSRIFPFAPKVGSKKGILQNINFQYSVRAENQIRTTDSVFGTAEMFDDAKIGAQHNIPLSTNFKLFKYLSVTASTNYEEIWTAKTLRRFFDAETEEIVEEDVDGFDAYRTYNFSTSLGTTIYGMFPFKTEKNNPKIQAIRHVMRPSISYNINPAFDQYYETIEVLDADGLTNAQLNQLEYSRFENTLYGAPNRRYSSSIGLGLGNNIEAKIRPKDSTETEPKKIKLLNNLNFSTSYNLAGDSLRLNPIRMNGGTTILNNKMNINFGATMDPYALSSSNRRIDKLNINNGGSLFRLTSANLNISYSLNNDVFKSREEEEEEEDAIDESVASGGRADDLFGRPTNASQRSASRNKNKEDKSEFYNYTIPWSLRLAYVVNYSNSTRQNTISSHSLMFSGDLDLSPNWSVSGSSGYDFVNKGFTLTRLNFKRSLLTWDMNFSWVPFGQYSQWNFFIGISSNLLRDLKYEQRKRRDQR